MVKSEPKKKPQSGGFFQKFFRKPEKNQKEQRLTVQRSIPYLEMGRDGICRVEEHLYSKTVRFYDINYQLAQNEDKNTIGKEKSLKYLVIAEKPSVSKSIAKVIGAYRQEDGYLEGGDCVVSWCLGHLAEYAAPEHYDERYENWRFEDLPILPVEWKLLVHNTKKPQFNVLRKLLRSKKFDYVVNACDAGREGEAIFRRVYALAGSKLPIKRLWISSMEDAAIQQGFENLKDGAAYDNLFAASECRAKADWLIGMNGTRAFTKKYGRKQTIGRVQTPTLAMLAERQTKIQNFVKEPYYKVELFGAGVVAVSEQMAQEQDADTMQAACDGQCAVVGSIERKRVEKKPPKLYDLTTLQREANRYYGMTASQTLQALQELYEEKLVTYPRTDSQFVTEDMRTTVESLVLALDGQTVDVSCVINNSKVTDHHAILSTMQGAKCDKEKLSETKQKILSLIIPFNNLINDTYCRDISLRVRSHLDVKRKEGQFIGSFAGYGYRKDPKDKNHLIIDEYAAGIVQEIFKQKLNGMSSQRIASHLNELGVLPPNEYKRANGFNYTCGFQAGLNQKWTVVSVNRILKNESYTGTLIQGKRRKINYKVKKSHDVGSENWIRVEDAHDAIISKGEFQQVQQLLELDTRTAPSQTTVYPLSGFLRCADCGQNMIRRTVTKNGKKYQYYHCSTYKNGGGCTPHMINSEKLTESVLAAIRHQVTLLVEAEKVLSNAELASGEQIGIKIGGLTKECVDAFVSMVYLYDDQTMKIEFNCEDVIRRALEKYGA